MLDTILLKLATLYAYEYDTADMRARQFNTLVDAVCQMRKDQIDAADKQYEVNAKIVKSLAGITELLGGVKVDTSALDDLMRSTLNDNA